MADAKHPSEPTVGKSPSTTSQPSETPAPTRRFFRWHEPGTSRADKLLIFKLDWFLLSFSCLTFFIKQLNGNNVTNAYNSGMSEELNFGPGNELSWMNTYFNPGTTVLADLLPIHLVVFRALSLQMQQTPVSSMPPGSASVSSESTAWPGVQYVLECWYTKSEIARRSGLFAMPGVLGQMFSGYLQAALYTGMEGRGRMRAWCWLFIFDFILAVPVAIYGLIFYPGTPETTTAFYLSEWERKRARRPPRRNSTGALSAAFRALGSLLHARAFVLGFMVSLGQAVVIPFQQLQFPSGQAPEFRETHGWPSGLAFVVALTVFTVLGIDAVYRVCERRGVLV
ncbi:uncharacterized protein BDV17DRAFT_295634 [Aspergillus undulatus]|uniref:uncharacterized protein n=1 Tax=Aspergillus undulatus TaxID=1810928 RepID=UPI003CCDFBE7